MIKKRSLDYLIDTEDGNNWVLDLDKKHIYCHWHIEQRLYEDDKGFIVCSKCNSIIADKKEGDSE